MSNLDNLISCNLACCQIHCLAVRGKPAEIRDLGGPILQIVSHRGRARARPATYRKLIYIYICMYVYMCMYVYIYIYMYVYMYVYMCMYVYVFMYVCM